MIKCKTCGKDYTENLMLTCPTCGAIMCPTCANLTTNICPYCYSTLNLYDL